MIVVNFATDQFKKGQKRLADSIVERGGTIVTYNDYKQLGSPTHQESPYEFKIWAIERAMQSFRNEDVFLWLDASVWAIGDLSVIENIISETGFFGEESGHYCYDWANEHCRKYHNLRKEEGLIMYSAGLTGIHREHSKEFMSQWKASAQAGCFKGEYKNHRHDMVNASIIAQRLGLPFQRGGTYLSYVGNGYAKPADSSIFLLQGIL